MSTRSPRQHESESDVCALRGVSDRGDVTTAVAVVVVAAAVVFGVGVSGGKGAVARSGGGAVAPMPLGVLTCKLETVRGEDGT